MLFFILVHNDISSYWYYSSVSVLQCVLFTGQIWNGCKCISKFLLVYLKKLTCLWFFPLFWLPISLPALIKSTGLKLDGRIDDRSFWINYVSSVSTPLAIPLVHPRMIAIHDLDSQAWVVFYYFQCYIIYLS